MSHPQQWKRLKWYNSEIKLNIDTIDYDILLSFNRVILNVFNSSPNNTILECIVRYTPIIVSKHPAIIEYLGETYPL